MEKFFETLDSDCTDIKEILYHCPFTFVIQGYQ